MESNNKFNPWTVKLDEFFSDHSIFEPFFEKLQNKLKKLIILIILIIYLPFFIIFIENRTLNL